MKLKRLVLWTKQHKRLSIAMALIMLVLLGGAVYFFVIRSPEPVARNQVVTKLADEEPAAPTTVASPLTGVAVAPDLAKRPVTAMVIENSPDARPQSGLDQAGVVFEAIAEGGITRFVALYQESRPSLIGPVRSLRPYFNDWALTFDAGVGHVGGSKQALDEVKQLGVKDLDQFFNGGSYWRATDRYAPHNVYTNFDRIDALNQKKGFTSSEFEPWPRKAEKKLAVAKAKTITAKISSYLYQVGYTYNPNTNTYDRTLAGEPHMNRETNTQLTPRVVVLMFTEYSRNNRDGRYHYTLEGSGEVWVFQDGNITKGQWQRDGRDKPFHYNDTAGKPIKLNPGQVWVTAVAPGESATYAP